jgi:acyl-CoA synthetase (AMP-forming)/AMP-acid ligase II
MMKMIGGRELVACGAPILETRVLMVDPSTGVPVADGQTGEIWVGGPSVAAGYWHRPEESAATFAARTESGEGPFLRTGDLGVMSGGQLFVAGRIKDVLIIRGQNYYPQDIETTVERSGAPVRGGAGAAFSIERDGEERLVVAYEVERTVKPSETGPHIDCIRAAIVRDHELHTDEVVLLRPGGAPKTSSGKIRRRACRDAYLEGSLDRLPSS